MAYFDYNNEIPHKYILHSIKLDNVMQYFKNGSTQDKPSKTFTCTKCSKLEITLTFIGASDPIFNNNAQYSSVAHFVRVNILIYLMFTFLNFILFFLHHFHQLLKFEITFKAMGKIGI